VTRIPIQGRNYFQRPRVRAVKALLLDTRLAFSDLAQAHLEHFIGCGSAEALDGVVGLELYPPYALLRSLAVAPRERGRGLGERLVIEAQRHAREHGVREMYLLTTSAGRFFARAGYEPLSRDAAPAAIRETSEFATICPASAALMRKVLG
jgi:amino-acid N-acetyltransferase